jgi:outer membrane protein
MSVLQEQPVSQKLVIRLALGAFCLSIAALVLFSVVLLTGGMEKKIGVVRSNHLIQQYKAMQDAQERYENKQKAWQANVVMLEQELQTAMEGYRVEYASLSTPEIKKREAQLEQKRTNYISYSQSIREKAAKEETEMMQGVLNQINSFVEDYGREHGFDVILGTTAAGNVLYGTESVDITNDVLKALNNAYSSGSNGVRNVSQ